MPDPILQLGRALWWLASLLAPFRFFFWDGSVIQIKIYNFSLISRISISLDPLPTIDPTPKLKSLKHLLSYPKGLDYNAYEFDD